MGKIRKVLISLFIVFNFLTMLRVHLPLDSKFFGTFYRPIDAYLSFFSIYQDWLMFAPNPNRLNLYVTADVEFDDGSTASYDFEHASSDTIWEKYAYGEKYRKFILDGLRKDENAWMRPDAARFALRKLKDGNYHKIPLKVHLTRHWTETPDPKVEWRPHGSKSTKYKSFKFYTYEVL